VECNSGPSLEYVSTPSEDGTETSVSFRINVLSTQHSNSLFLISINLGRCSVTSEAIKSVSKPEQIRKKLAQNDCSETHMDDETKSKKRARSEELLETLAVIQTQQAHQTELISCLFNQRNTQSHCSEPKKLEDAIETLISTFEIEERPNKICKYITGLDQKKKQTLLNLSLALVNQLQLVQPVQNQSIQPQVYFHPFSCPDSNILGLIDENTATQVHDDEEDNFSSWFEI